MSKKSLIVGIDFDGTCLTHEFPNLGKDIGAVPVLKRLVAEGHKLMLWTMRSNMKHSTGVDTLQDAVNWFKKNEIPLWSVNDNPTQKSWTLSKKQHADFYIDDAAIGCPLVQEFQTVGEGKDSRLVPVGRPFVSWPKIEKGLESQGILTIKQEDDNKATDNV